LIRSGVVSAVHDVSDGGLLIAVAEMAMASGIGAVLEAPSGIPPHAFWFGEDQARYVVTAKDAHGVMQQAKTAGVPLTRLGATGGTVLAVDGERPLPVDELKRRFEAWLPAYMAGSPS
jgi:phosphoribosylformylglycinamidine synthase